MFALPNDLKPGFFAFFNKKNTVLDYLFNIFTKKDIQLLEAKNNNNFKNNIKNSLFWASFGDAFGNEVEFTKNIIDPYLISFHELMQNEDFRKKHRAFFPDKVSERYIYDSKEFPGFDAGTCFAAAIYNFALWIPENHREITDKNYIERCMTNALMSSVITGGDSDSIAGISGALCGAAFSIDSVPEKLKNVIEDSILMEYYAQALAKKASGV